MALPDGVPISSKGDRASFPIPELRQVGHVPSLRLLLLLREGKPVDVPESAALIASSSSATAAPRVALYVALASFGFLTRFALGFDGGVGLHR